jgi:hypothetical protein
MILFLFLSPTKGSFYCHCFGTLEIQLDLNVLITNRHYTLLCPILYQQLFFNLCLFALYFSSICLQYKA